MDNMSHELAKGLARSIRLACLCLAVGTMSADTQTLFRLGWRVRAARYPFLHCFRTRAALACLLCMLPAAAGFAQLRYEQLKMFGFPEGSGDSLMA